MGNTKKSYIIYNGERYRVDFRPGLGRSEYHWRCPECGGGFWSDRFKPLVCGVCGWRKARVRILDLKPNK